MADWRDVMEARTEADNARQSCEVYGEQIEDEARASDFGLAVLLAAIAVASELRALGTTLDYASRG